MVAKVGGLRNGLLSVRSTRWDYGLVGYNLFFRQISRARSGSVRGSRHGAAKSRETGRETEHIGLARRRSRRNRLKLSLLPRRRSMSWAIAVEGGAASGRADRHGNFVSVRDKVLPHLFSARLDSIRAGPTSARVQFVSDRDKFSAPTSGARTPRSRYRSTAP